MNVFLGLRLLVQSNAQSERTQPNFEEAMQGPIDSANKTGPA
jgi:hypothetical protein